MNRTCRMVLGLGLLTGLLGVVGCHSDRPHEYGRQRPPVDQLDPRDRGLQSKDVVSATEELSMDLLALPELSQSDHRWTIVVTDVENLTTDPRFNYDIFIERLRTQLAQRGRGRVALIENRAKLRELQRRELDVERDDFGQGPGGQRAQPDEIQPDYALWGRVMEMPGRGTSYYLANFTLTNLQTREQVWSDAYEVRVAR